VVPLIPERGLSLARVEELRREAATSRERAATYADSRARSLHSEAGGLRTLIQTGLDRIDRCRPPAFASGSVSSTRVKFPEPTWQVGDVGGSGAV
jgi:hypothetical protein